jgi:hypothetical protein
MSVLDVDAGGASGVPEITQVFGLTEAQEGSAVVPLLIPQEVIGAPLEFKVVAIYISV